MDAKKIRLENLKALISEFGSAVNVAKETGVNEAYISQVISGTLLPSGNPRGVGDKMARKLEEGCKKPFGWMDTIHKKKLDTDPKKLFAARLTERMKQKQVDVATLKEQLGIPPLMVEEYLLGNVMPRLATLSKIAEILDCEESWLLYGSANITEEAETRGMVPVISWVAAGNWSNIEDPFEPGTADRWLPCPVKHSANTFALRVTGLSMYNPHGKPSFEDGDIIYVDPYVVAENKSCVVVRMDDEETATFKQMIIEGNKKYLKPLNPDWPEKILEINGNATICGVVIGKWVDM